MVKRCFKCGTEKPIGEFYRHPAMADKHLNKCKTCTKTDMCVDRHTKPRVREYDRQRASLPHRKALQTRVSAAWRAKYPERARAHDAANNAKRDGRLDPAPTLCEGCSLTKTLQKHHPDYARPLLIVWLCKPCHAIADKIRRRTESAA